MESRLGTAEWEDLDVFAERHAYEEGDFWIGRSPKTGEPLGYADDRHILLASKSRSGKGTTTIMNNLLTWQGSMVVVDPKGENATVTASRRGDGSDYCEGMGQRVFVLDPFGASSVHDKYRASFNPLDALDPKSTSVIDDAGLIADAIIPERPDAKDPYFDLTARKMLKGLILHVITAPHFEGRRDLLTVRALIRHGEREGLEKIKAARAARNDGSEKRRPLPSAFQLLWSDVAANHALEGIIAGIGESIANSAIEASKTFDNCLSTLDRHTEFLDSFEMKKVLERSDFSLSDLKTDPRGVSLYLCLPQRYTAEHYRWLRLMNTLVITMMEEVKEQPATGHRVLMVLDEFLLLEYMKVIERAVPYIAGYGLTMFFVVQSLEHLKKVYSETWETLIANCGIKMFYAVGDHFSRKYISDLIGETEVIREAESWSEQRGTSTSETHGESSSQTEGVSESTAEGKSQSLGQTEQRSTTHGTSESVSDAVSETRGWNEGQSDSRTKGKQRSSSRGTSENDSEGYSPSKLFRNTERHFRLLRENETKNLATGSNRGSTFGRNWSRSRSTSSGTSGSQTLSRTTSGGRSHSETTGSSKSVTESESFTHTRGQSASKTSGINESTTTGSSQTSGSSRNQTVHKRPLITPDEIGRYFARPPEPSNDPAWGLVLIDDAKPAVVHRVEYYQDLFFGWLFDPHPDHAPPPMLITTHEISPPLVIPDLAEFSKVYWTREPGAFVRRGEEIARVDLPGPRELVEIGLVALTGDMSCMEGVVLEQGVVQLKLFSERTGEISELCLHHGESFADRDRVAQLRGNNRKWLLESEITGPVPCPISDYSNLVKDLYRREAAGRVLHQQMLEQQAATEERARLALLEQERAEREAEEARIARERREQEERERARAEAAEKARREAKERAIELAFPAPKWINEGLLFAIGAPVGVLIGASMDVEVNSHWVVTIFIIWIVGGIAGGFMGEPVFEWISKKYSERAERLWDALPIAEQAQRVERELHGYAVENQEQSQQDMRKSFAESLQWLFGWLVGLMGFAVGAFGAYRAWRYGNQFDMSFAEKLQDAAYAFIPMVGVGVAIGVILDLLVTRARAKHWDARQTRACDSTRMKTEPTPESMEARRERLRKQQVRIEKRIGVKPAACGGVAILMALVASAVFFGRDGTFDSLTDGLATVAISGVMGIGSYACSVIGLRWYYRSREGGKIEEARNRTHGNRTLRRRRS